MKKILRGDFELGSESWCARPDRVQRVVFFYYRSFVFLFSIFVTDFSFFQIFIQMTRDLPQRPMSTHDF